MQDMTGLMKMMKLNHARDVSFYLPKPSSSAFESCIIGTQKLLNQRNQISNRTNEICITLTKKLQYSST